jgi:ribosomal protein S6--L-glutamate ligase
LKQSRRIIRDNRSLIEQYDLLEAGDIVCGRLRLRPHEEHILVDLLERGVLAVPSFRSQLCSKSKTFQTRLFHWAMLPDTVVIYTIHDVLQAIRNYGQSGIKKVVVKQEGKNGGLGVFLYQSIEDVYTQSATGVLPFPYVLQPFISDCRDLRIIIIGDYIETYERANPYNFRHNLHCGGAAVEVKLTEEQLILCKRIMAQGGFPYAHIDLMITDDATTYFTEINLRGGLRGARIDSPEYHRRIEELQHSLCEDRIKKEA